MQNQIFRCYSASLAFLCSFEKLEDATKYFQQYFNAAVIQRYANRFNAIADGKYVGHIQVEKLPSYAEEMEESLGGIAPDGSPMY